MTDQIATAEDIRWGEDFYAHRIQGQAHQDRLSRYFDIPLATHVEGNLWQGGVWPGVRLPDDFAFVVNLYGLSYAIGENTTELQARMMDSSTQGFDDVDKIAGEVVKMVAFGPTLVHCQAGLNRSGLIAARALMLMGDSAATAINKLRKRSPVVLCNESFTNWLHGLASDA